MSAYAYRDDAPTSLAEAQSDEYNPVTWFPTGPAGSALAALLEPANGIPTDIDNAQH